MTSLSRFRGCLLGLAVGDALGAPVEFRRRGTFPRVTEMVSGGVHRIEAGQWTDDTSLALCLAESILEAGWNTDDQLERYRRWWREGYLSSTGRCFDIGGITEGALLRFERGERPTGLDHPDTAGNGSLMRLAPVVMRYYREPSLLDRVRESSSTTHAVPEAVQSCEMFGLVLQAALKGHPRPLGATLGGTWLPSLQPVADHAWARKPRMQIRASGHCVRSLEAAFWCFGKTRSFEEALIEAVNLGEDADTVGAITGQLAGAFYGIDSIPARWLEPLAQRQMIDDLAVRLYHAANPS